MVVPVRMDITGDMLLTQNEPEHVPFRDEHQLRRVVDGEVMMMAQQVHGTVHKQV